MKKTQSFRNWLLVVWLLSLLLVTAAPTAAAGEDLIRLSIENRDAKNIFLRLEGPRVYLLKITGNSTKIFSVQKGDYSYRVSGCGLTSSGTLELNAKTTLVMPVCGGNLSRAAQKAGKVDLSAGLKIARVTLINKTNGGVKVVLIGPAVYVFSLKEGETKEYTLAAGRYRVRNYACGDVFGRPFRASKGVTMEITCPK